mmetsp:Transcript_75807/g.190681  ORF Transcript_75807/g.190681 Transcript_75807/m.190681 type:complete len:250 (-) Transcript_75807:163-912(-)
MSGPWARYVGSVLGGSVPPERPGGTTAHGRRRRFSSDDWQAVVDYLCRTAFLNDRAQQAMRMVDRAEFVPGDGNPYIDAPQRIGHRATISAPHMHAAALNLLSSHLKPGARVLDVGSGSGYLSAVMALMVGPKGKVIGIDYLEPLVQLSRENVSKSQAALLRNGQLRLDVGDGWKGCPRDAPFDAIHVGAAASVIPAALIEQLKPGGRMVLPVGEPGGEQCFTQLDKDLGGHCSVKRFGSVVYVPLVHV